MMENFQQSPLDMPGGPDPNPQQKSFPHATFGQRLLAFVVDWIIITVVVKIATYVTFSSNDPIFDMENPMLMIDFAAIYLGMYVFYNTLFESSTRQATPGKMLLKIKVTDLDGERISFWRALARRISKTIFGSLFGITYIVAMFHEQNRALHDLIAGTYVLERQVA